MYGKRKKVQRKPPWVSSITNEVKAPYPSGFNFNPTSSLRSSRSSSPVSRPPGIFHNTHFQSLAGTYITCPCLGSPSSSKDKAGILCLSRWGLAPRRCWQWLAWQQTSPGHNLHFTLLCAPTRGSPDAQCVLSLHVASRIPSLAIHAPHSGPCVRLRIVGLHGAQPQLTIISPDSIEEPVHHSHTYTASGCCHGMALFPAIGDRVEHFHHIQGITCIKICYSN